MSEAETERTQETAMALAEAGTSSIAEMTPDQVDRAVEAIEAAAAGTKRLLQAALSFTQPGDWVLFGEIPYLQGSGAERMMAIGLQLSKPTFTITEVGKHDLFVECEVEIAWPATGRKEYAIGSRDTRDDFFTKGDRSAYGKALEQAQGDERLARRMLLADLKKAAYQNAKSRAVTAVLGLRNLSVEQLSAIKGGSMTQVDFDEGDASGSAAPSKPAVQAVQAKTSTPRGNGKRNKRPENIPHITTSAHIPPTDQWFSADITVVKVLHQDKRATFSAAIGDVVVEGWIVWASDDIPIITAHRYSVVVEVRDYKGQRQLTVREAVDNG